MENAFTSEVMEVAEAAVPRGPPPMVLDSGLEAAHSERNLDSHADDLDGNRDARSSGDGRDATDGRDACDALDNRGDGYRLGNGRGNLRGGYPHREGRYSTHSRCAEEPPARRRSQRPTTISLRSSVRSCPPNEAAWFSVTDGGETLREGEAGESPTMAR